MVRAEQKWTLYCVHVSLSSATDHLIEAVILWLTQPDYMRPQTVGGRTGSHQHCHSDLLLH